MLTTPPDRWPDFQQDLLAVLDNPRVKGLALRRAGDHDLAEDALQATFCAVSRVADPAAIRDLTAYVCKVLIREIYSLRGQLGATLVEDFASLADARQGRSGDSPPLPQLIAETVSMRLLAEAWLEPFAIRRRELTDSAPNRSPDPRHYRDMIVNVAECMLCRIITEIVTDADFNAALSTAYPEWFDEPGCAENTRHQRFRRAREDVRSLLRTIIDPDDLKP